MEDKSKKSTWNGEKKVTRFEKNTITEMNSIPISILSDGDICTVKADKKDYIYYGNVWALKNENYTTEEKQKLESISSNADETQTAINAAPGKTTLDDADTVPLLDSKNNNGLKKITILNFKKAIQPFFDNIYTTAKLKLTGYTKPTTPSLITSTSTINEAIGNFDATMEQKANKDGTLQQNLNSDMLNGKHSNDFATTAQGAKADITTTQGFSNRPNSANIKANPDNLLDTGIYALASNASLPATGSGTIITLSGSDTKNNNQLAIGFWSEIANRMFLRSRLNDVYGNWVEVWTANNLPVESGSWNPKLEGSTATGAYTANLAYGYYYRIGNLIFIDSYLNLSGITGFSGNISITGLPFSTGTRVFGLTIAHQNLISQLPLMTVKYAAISLYRSDASATGITANELRSSGYLAFSGCYRI